MARMISKWLSAVVKSGINSFQFLEQLPFQQYPKETPEIQRRKEVWRSLLRKALLNP